MELSDGKILVMLINFANIIGIHCRIDFIPPEPHTVTRGSSINISCVSFSDTLPVVLQWRIEQHHYGVEVITENTFVTVLMVHNPQHNQTYTCSGFYRSVTAEEKHFQRDFRLIVVEPSPCSEKSQSSDCVSYIVSPAAPVYKMSKWDTESTVYVGMGTAVGLVVLISLSVVAMCRVRMQQQVRAQTLRNELRRQCRNANRTHRSNEVCVNMSSCIPIGNSNQYASRNCPALTDLSGISPLVRRQYGEPYPMSTLQMSGYSPQFMQDTEFIIMQPPPYSEVVLFSDEEAPPPYSTIDRLRKQPNRRSSELKGKSTSNVPTSDRPLEDSVDPSCSVMNVSGAMTEDSACAGFIREPIPAPDINTQSQPSELDAAALLTVINTTHDQSIEKASHLNAGTEGGKALTCEDSADNTENYLPIPQPYLDLQSGDTSSQSCACDLGQGVVPSPSSIDEDDNHFHETDSSENYDGSILHPNTHCAREMNGNENPAFEITI